MTSITPPLKALEPESSSAPGSSRTKGRPRRLQRRPWRFSFVVIATYATVALIANWPAWPGDSAVTRQGDPSLAIWFISWWPHAIAHGWNPFFTTSMNYPVGINLEGNTSMPLLALLLSPVTMLVSPIASLNILNWLAFPASASAMYFVLRRWTHWPLAAAIGGALYGFSPYMVGQDLDHVLIAFVPLPPLIFLCIYELFVRQTGSSRRWGTALGGLFVAQFFISQEIAATTALVGIIGLTVLMIARPRQVVAAIRFAAPGGAIAFIIAAVLLAYPLWAAVAGPYHYSGPAHGGGLNADLLGAFLPTSKELLTPAAWVTHGDLLVAGNVPENGSYLGAPLVTLLAYVAVRYRRDRWIRFGTVLLVLTWMLTLGGRLLVNGTPTSIPLPWTIFEKAPLFDNLLSVRLNLYVYFFVALLVGMGLDQVRLGHGALREKEITWRSIRTLRKARPRSMLITLLTVATVLSLVPRWPNLGTGLSEVPSYFSTPAVDRIPLGSVVLISPYPSVAETLPDLWLAIAGSRFKIIGGYGQFAVSTGGSSVFPAILQPSSIETYLFAEVAGGGFPNSKVPTAGPLLVHQMRTFLIRYHVGTVLYTTAGSFPQNVATLFTETLGSPSAAIGGVTAWYGVQQLLQRKGPGTGTSG